MTADRAENALDDVVAVERMAPGMVKVVTWSAAYPIDARGEGCNCPDKQYNLAPGEKCKHEIAAMMSDVDRLPSPGIVTDNLSRRTATDGGEEADADSTDRPDTCECRPGDALPCAACGIEGFDKPAEC